MKIVLLVSRDDPELALAEVCMLLKTSLTKQDGLLFADVRNLVCVNRLAYTNLAVRLLFSCRNNYLLQKMQKYDWNRVYDKDFSVRKLSAGAKVHISEKALASCVWNKVTKPKVNLTDAKTKVIIIVTKKNCHVGTLLWKNRKEYLKRKPHLRPGLHPTSLSPKLARACVNLLGGKGTIVDPFCGTGGLLIEAGLMGLPVVGYDISQDMLKRARTNMQHFRIKRFRLEKRNAVHLDKRYKFYATDLPYGKNTRNIDNELYSRFLAALGKIKSARAVLIFPDYAKYKSLLNRLKILAEFTVYIHKSLSKRIVLLKTP